MSKIEAGLSEWLAKTQPEVFIQATIKSFPALRKFTDTDGEDDALLKLLKDLEIACRVTSKDFHFFRETLMDMFHEIRYSTPDPRNSSDGWGKEPPERRPAFLKTKAWIMEQVAHGWNGDCNGHSKRAFDFLIACLDDHATPGFPHNPVNEHFPRFVSQRERDKVLSALKERIGTLQLPMYVIQKWITPQLPEEAKRVLEAALRRKSPVYLLDRLHPEDRSEAALKFVPEILHDLAELDRNLDQLMNELQAEFVDLELVYCCPLFQFGVGIVTRFKNTNPKTAYGFFGRAKDKINTFMETYRFLFPFFLYPKGGPDNLAWGLKNWTWEPEPSPEARELELLRFANWLCVLRDPTDILATYDKTLETIHVVILPETPAGANDEELIDSAKWHIEKAASDILKGTKLTEVTLEIWVRTGAGKIIPVTKSLKISK